MFSAKISRATGYLALGRVAVLEFLAYRANLVVEFLSYPLAFLGYFFFLHGLFLFGHGPQNYPLPELLTYFSLGWMLRMIFHQGVDLSLSSMIATGQIAQELLRPLDLRLMMATRFASLGAARLLGYALPSLALLALLFSPFLVWLPENLLGFVIFLAVGFWLSFELQFLIGVLAFYVTMNYQISWTLDLLIRLASGLIIPLDLYPPWVARSLDILPFKYLYFIPLKVYLGRLPASDLILALLVGLAWWLALWALNRLLLHRALKQLAILGS
jgi:ABC-2 type transport system permease protein